MLGLGGAFNAILEKFGKFFDLFNLSYFVSGAVAMSALMWGLEQTRPDAFDNINKWLAAAAGATVLGCYVAGLMCFAAGRLLRLRWVWVKCKVGVLHRSLWKLESEDSDECDTRTEWMRQAVLNHGLEGDALISRYIGNIGGQPPPKIAPGKLWSLYTRLWAQMRQDAGLKTSLDHLDGFWIRSATYDGLAIALLIWVAALWLVCIHGRVPLSFETRDIRKPESLVSRIKWHIDEPSAYLYGLLVSPGGYAHNEVLTVGTTKGGMGDDWLKEHLVCLLNYAISKESLRRDRHFASVGVCNYTWLVLRRDAGKDSVRQRRQNRLLLEAAYPGVLAPHSKPYYVTAACTMILLLLLVLGCLTEADKHFQNQVEELLATYAWWKDNPPKP